MCRLFSREYLEMGDTFSSFIYLIFIITHALILVFKYLLRKKEKESRIVIGLSILPSIVTGIIIMVSIISGLLSLTN